MQSEKPIPQEKQYWFSRWFNADYLKLYAHRNEEEAEKQTLFLIKTLKLKKDEKILDLGCGSGRHAFAFAKHGLQATGIDNSRYLIDEAKKKQKDHPELKVSFILGDMRDLNSLPQFDLITCLFTSFGYFEDDNDNNAILKAAKDHLKKGKSFFLDYLNPASVKKRLVPYEQKNIQGEKIIIKKHIEENTLIKEIFFPNRDYVEKVKLYDHETLREMLEQNQLHVVETWGDYDGNPFTFDSKRQLLLCKRV